MTVWQHRTCLQYMYIVHILKISTILPEFKFSANVCIILLLPIFKSHSSSSMKTYNTYKMVHKGILDDFLFSTTRLITLFHFKPSQYNPKDQLLLKEQKKHNPSFYQKITLECEIIYWKKLPYSSWGKKTWIKSTKSLSPKKKKRKWFQLSKVEKMKEITAFHSEIWPLHKNQTMINLSQTYVSTE